MATANIYLHSGLGTMVHGKMRLLRPQQTSILRSTHRRMARETTLPLSHLIQPMCRFTTCHSCVKLQMISLKFTACQLIQQHLVAFTQCKHRFLHHHQSAKLMHLSQLTHMFNRISKLPPQTSYHHQQLLYRGPAAHRCGAATLHLMVTKPFMAPAPTVLPCHCPLPRASHP